MGNPKIGEGMLRHIVTSLGESTQCKTTTSGSSNRLLLPPSFLLRAALIRVVSSVSVVAHTCNLSTLGS
uniref:Unnamed protein product n=1 Tax=Macaca fascicularis TaxID=9541 RepID=Q9N095_MACFA|nr:unnamed protein product [Macaca fascicularis]